VRSIFSLEHFMHRFPRVMALAACLSLSLAACSDKAPAPAPKPAPAAAPAVDPNAAVVGEGPSGQTIVDPSKGPAVNDSDAVGRRIHELYPAMTVASVQPMEALPMFEIRIREWGLDKVGYTDKNVSYIYFDGELYTGDAKNFRNVSRERKNERVIELIKQLPFNKALSYTFGSGERTLVVFEDPDCPECMALENDFKKAGAALNMTLKVLPMPLNELHPQAEQRARYMLCTANPEAVWNAWVTTPMDKRDWAKFSAQYPATAGCERAKAVDEVWAVSEQLGLNQTPILMFDNGMTFNGRATMEELEKSFAYIEAAKQAASQAQAAAVAPAPVPATPAPAAAPAPAPAPTPAPQK